MAFWKHLFVAVALAAGSVQAETNYFAQATAAQTNVFLGQVFTVDVVVKAPEKPETPDLENLPGFNATVLDAGSATARPDTYLFRYAFRATEAGDLTIPPLPFGNLATAPLAIHAVKPKPTDRMTLAQTLSAQSVFVGEPVVLTTVWDSTYPFGALKAVDFSFPILHDPRFQILEPYEPEKEHKKQTTGLPVQGTRVLATRRSYKVGNVQHQSLAFSKILIPKKAGKLSIPPCTLLCAAEKEKDTLSPRGRRNAFQYPAYFDNTFFDQNLSDGHYVRIYTESAPLSLEVKPLPAEGRPALFNGMVGDFSINVSADPVAVRVGEPITLTITVTAQRHMENIFFPPLRYQPQLANRFEIPSERSLPQRVEKSKTYTQTIRPLSEAINEIPPIQLAFFSPASNAYVVVESKPIPLKVSPAEAIAAYGMDYRAQPRAAKGGIRQNHEAPDMLENRPLPILGWAPPLLFAIILLLPPLLAGGTELVAHLGKRKEHIHRTAKAARAYRVYRKNAAHIAKKQRMKSEIHTRLDRVLRAYLGDRLQLNPGALSFREAEARLVEAGADLQTLEKLRELFALCETYRFTSGYDEPGNAKQIVRNANRIVKAIERSLK